MQIRNNVFDFLALIELVPVDDLVRDTGGFERMFQCAGKVVSAIKNGVVARTALSLLNRQCNRIGNINRMAWVDR